MSLYDKLTQINENLIVKSDITPISKNISKDWMSSIFGFGDSDMSNYNIFKNTDTNYQKQKIIRAMLNKKTIYNLETGELKLQDATFQAGWFLTPTVSEIIETLNKIKQPSKNQNYQNYNIVVVKGKDVGLAHVESQPFEIFQGASQFNSLEMVDVNKTQYDGIEIYINDNTQGPRQALACAPGTFVRNYYITNEYGSQFNALENLTLSPLNGYLIWGTEPEKIKLKNINLMMIPSMVYTQVEGVTKQKNQIVNHKTNKMVHQIYSSAVPINTYGNGGDLTTQNLIAEEIVYNQYLGVIGMGLILHSFDKKYKRSVLKRPRINLTLIGGGVFNLDILIIINCINKAINYYKGYEFDIYLHAFSNNEAEIVSTHFNIDIVEFGTDLDLNTNNYDDYVLVIPNKNGIIIYKLRDYQKDMLELALSSKDGNYKYTKADVRATVFIKTYSNGYKKIGFVGDDGVMKYFVNLETDPNFKYYNENNGVYNFYDINKKLITSWNT